MRRFYDDPVPRRVGLAEDELPYGTRRLRCPGPRRPA
jgi:hypothetical protein